MRALAGLALLLTCVPHPAWACGAHAIGRPATPRRAAAAARPTLIVLYRVPFDAAQERSLVAQGHEVIAVSDDESFARLLRSRPVDIVVAPANISRRLAEATAVPLIIPAGTDANEDFTLAFSAGDSTLWSRAIALLPTVRHDALRYDR